MGSGEKNSLVLSRSRENELTIFNIKQKLLLPVDLVYQAVTQLSLFAFPRVVEEACKKVKSDFCILQLQTLPNQTVHDFTATLLCQKIIKRMYWIRADNSQCKMM